MSTPFATTRPARAERASPADVPAPADDATARRAREGVQGLGAAGEPLRVDAVLRELVACGVVSAADGERVGRYAALSTSNRHALVALAEHRLKAAQPPHRPLDVDALGEWLGRRCGLDYVHIDPLRIDFSRLGEVMSSSYATRYGILPLEVRPHEVVIATAEPLVTGWTTELSQVLRRDVRRVLANPVEIQRYIVEFFNLAKSVRGAQKAGAVNQHGNFEQLVELGRSGKSLDANDQHIVTIVDWLWQYAFEQRASDIHLEPRRDLGVVRFRIDGVLHNVYQIPPAVLSAMTSRIKLLGRMDVVEKRRPQDGRIKTRGLDGREVELRLSTLPTAFGEKLVMRIFDPDVLARDFAELGFSDEDQQRWSAMTHQPHGIVLVTGPTGAGKTSTLYSTLRQLATEEVNVCTVEDPIEMVEPRFNQMQVQPGIELGFADGIRALMRQDPDIIMVGEIRDLETAEMAVQAALTGHLVLSTLHTNDAPSAVSRLLDLGVPSYLLKATLLGVMAQRLVRTLCPHCRAPAPATADSGWDELIRPYRSRRPASLYRPVGCLECRMTGYRGRTGVYEILTLDNDLRALIGDRPDPVAIRAQAIRSGMKPLRLAGATKVAAGVTSIEEILRSAPPADGG